MGDGGGVGWQEDELDGLEGAVDDGIAVVQDEDLLPLQSVEDLVLLVKPGAEEVASHPGLLVGVKLHWRLMDFDHLLAENVRLPAVVDDHGFSLWVPDMFATGITVILEFELLPPLPPSSLKIRDLLD